MYWFATLEEDLNWETMVSERKVILGCRLYGSYFHDTYHTSQTDVLQKVAGANDNIISSTVRPKPHLANHYWRFLIEPIRRQRL